MDDIDSLLQRNQAENRKLDAAMLQSQNTQVDVRKAAEYIIPDEAFDRESFRNFVLDPKNIISGTAAYKLIKLGVMYFEMRCPSTPNMSALITIVNEVLAMYPNISREEICEALKEFPRRLSTLGNDNQELLFAFTQSDNQEA